jgi:hypothetical protein
MMTPEEARDIARGYKGFATHLHERRVVAEARYMEQQAQWWLTYAIALAQTDASK